MFALQAIAVVVAAAVLGLGSAWLALERDVGFEAIRAGAWTAWPQAGDPDSDPYLRARLARSGVLPLTRPEGIAFSAREDDTGRRLTSRCEYRISGRMPAAQWWSVAIYRDGDITLTENRAGRYGFDSTDIMLAEGGGVEIVVAARARPGNWLPVDPEAGALRFVLRLYDTPLATGGRPGEVAMPRIERGACR